jgi:glutathionylspermidine synthase
MMTFQVMGYPHSDRTARIKELYELGFTWADLDDEPYWMDQIVAMESAAYTELFTASERLWHIFDLAARFVMGKHDLYEQLSIPEVLWDGLDQLEPNPTNLISRYARFDFSVSQDGRIKLLELNADTPTGYVEASVATPWLCDQYKLLSPNKQMASLLKAAWATEQPAYAACVAYGTHIEDTGTIDMLVRHSGLAIPCIDCLELWVDDGILKEGQDLPVSSLFALYPKEWMSVDDGGEALAYSIENRHVDIYNPLHAILLQSKGLQSIIWGLHELESELFTLEDHDTIEKYMLPTYNSPVFESSYISKSMFGREGGSVRMFNDQGELDIEDQEGFDTSQFFGEVYQTRAELPRISFHNGDNHLLTGVFIINGVPCGLLGRAGGLITGNSSQFVAIGVKEIEK